MMGRETLQMIYGKYYSYIKVMIGMRVVHSRERCLIPRSKMLRIRLRSVAYLEKVPQKE